MGPRDCPLCREPARGATVSNFFDVINCERCGEFSVNTLAESLLKNLDELHRLSGVTRNATLRGDHLKLTADNIELLMGSAPATSDVETKGRMLLRSIAKLSQRPGGHAKIAPAKDWPLCFAADEDELLFLARHLRGVGLATVDASAGELSCCLTAEGWRASQSAPRILSEKAFVAMWFDPRMQSAWDDGLFPAIRSDARFRPVRIDSEEHNDMIDDRIQAEIRESRFLIADLTGHRNGVYFEAGFALGLGTPVIWTCRKDDAEGTHFDARQYNRIQWETPAELREKLALRIRASIGVGPLREEEHDS